MDDSWKHLQVELKRALDEIVRGNAEPYKQLWSHAADISIMGAFGGYAQGWEAISMRLDWVATQYHDGVYDEYELLTETVGTDLAYAAWREKISSRASGGGTYIVRQRRGTEVYRRENSAWRIVHQHTDPLVDLEPPPT